MRHTQGKARILNLISVEAKSLLETLAFHSRMTQALAVELSIRERAEKILTPEQFRDACASAGSKAVTK